MLNSKEFVRELQLRHESAWMNPNLESADAALAALPLTRTDVDDAEARLERFAPFIVEPSACAGFAGAVELSKMTDYLESSGLGAHWENAAHIVWATGGALVPEGECENYLAN